MSSSRTTRRERRATQRLEGKRRKKLMTLAAGAAVMGAAGVSANAATIVVNTTADVVANDDGKCSLREAVAAANTDTASGAVPGECIAGTTGLDTIDLSSLSGTITLQSAAGYYALNVNSPMTFNGPAAGGLSISGGGATSLFYMYNTDPAATPMAVAINNLTLENGYNTNSGGAIVAYSPAGINLTISGSTLQNNVSGNGGGALVFASFSATGPLSGKYGVPPLSAGSLTITNTTFTNNTANIPAPVPTQAAQGGPGGAIGIKYAGGGTNITLDHVTITGNHAQTAGGGVVANLLTGSTMVVKNSVISGNDAGLVGDAGTYSFSGGGGGLALYGRNLYYVGPAGLKAVTLSAHKDSGVPLKPRAHAATDPTVTITDSTISNNQSDRAGGGVIAENLALTIDRSTLSGNTSTYGGGAALYGVTANITNATVAKNNALYYGGGLGLYNDAVTIDNATITGNTAAVKGGGINLYSYSYYGGGPTTITNSIIANNTPAPQVLSTGDQPTTISFSDIFPADASPTWVDGGSNKSADPLLGALAANGTPNQGANNASAPLVEIPGPGSPVIDAGNTAAAAGSTDERGAARVQGVAVDMGAVEAVVVSGTITTTPTVIVNESAGTVTITLTRTGGTTGDIVVNYSTANGTATAPSDYATRTGTVTFPSGGATTQTITIPIVSDSIPENPEKFTLNLSTATSGATVGTPVVTITILDPATVPTLAFWMKLMLALTCAGVGVVMLKNGRILVVMLAAGIAVAAAPPLHAAPVAQANASARRHRDPATTGTVTSVVASKTSKTVTITIGTTVYNVLRSHVRIQNADGKMRHPGTLQDLTPGTAVLVRVVRNSDNSIQRLRLAVFTSLANANTALARFQARHPHH